MITKESLKQQARILGLNLGQAEKNYFQDIVLFVIYRNYGKNVVFKGGTALKKCYGLDRFSEDLDFTCLEKIEVGKIDSELKKLNMEFDSETSSYENGIKVTFRIEGPLYAGIRQSLCKLVTDFSLREKVILRPEIKTIGRFLEELPEFDVFVMQEAEILAEKIRALMTRVNARDVYDLWFLLERGVRFDRELADKKLEYYGIKWNRKGFEDRMRLRKEIWRTELGPLTKKVPDFNRVRKKVLESIK